MTDDRLRAAIVGLGQVGMLFDEEPERKASGEIWTHFTAYERLSETYNLTAAVEPDPVKQALALNRRPEIRIYFSVEEMFRKERLDVVSICTPDATHLSLVSKLLGCCRGVFLEKPLCSCAELVQADALACRIRELGMSLRVNYYKRHEPLVRKVADRLGEERVVNIAVKYSGPFSAVGSHALNLMLYFAPDLTLDNALRHQRQEGDGYSGFFRASDGTMGQVIYCGPRHDLVFQVEVTTERGFYSLERNLSCLRVYAYSPSVRYGGYRELTFVSEEQDNTGAERFMGFLSDIALELTSGQCDYSSLDESLTTQKIMLAMERFGQKE